MWDGVGARYTTTTVSPLAWKMILTRSSGAMIVFAPAPAMPPAMNERSMVEVEPCGRGGAGAAAAAASSDAASTSMVSARTRDRELTAVIAPTTNANTGTEREGRSTDAW